ncbi:CoxG family protein [Salinigranum marinum]|uniref:CoxG family protein n=1 Tax=Salinigranum marinum TaxID=1515595 RepID=UPI002989E9FE|nr:SRPBCC domain-containing protein [Salinigranum marinum]
MEFEGEVEIETTKTDLWRLISDPEALVTCVPGAKEVHKQSATRYTGLIERGVAGVTITLDGEVEIVELNEPTSMRAIASGTDSKTNSQMDAQAEMDLRDDGDELTLQYGVTVEFTGKLATLGSRLVKRKVKSDIDTYFENVREHAEDHSS